MGPQYWRDIIRSIGNDVNQAGFWITASQQGNRRSRDGWRPAHACATRDDRASLVSNQGSDGANRNRNQAIVVPTAVIERKATVDDFTPKLCGRFVDGEIYDSLNPIVVEQLEITDVERVANIQQIRIDMADHSGNSFRGRPSQNVSLVSSAISVSCSAHSADGIYIAHQSQSPSGIVLV